MATRTTRILDFNVKELSKDFESLKLKKYRAKQVLDWIYKKRVYDFASMTNISKDTASLIESRYSLFLGNVVEHLKSEDGATSKILLELKDGSRIESVLIRSGKRRTACLSSQVGCKFGCKFCASSKGGFKRNLRASEILAQALRIRDLAPEPLTNIVFMGVGEPLDNYDETVKALRLLTDPELFEMGQRKITISSCGVVPAIRRLAKEKLQVELSISLHGWNDAVRSKLMPVNKRYKVEDLVSACSDFVCDTKRYVTFEYVMIEGLNDSLEDAVRLRELLKGVGCKVNLIPLSPVKEFRGTAPAMSSIKAFLDVLNGGYEGAKHGGRQVTATIRHSVGSDIHAACGQLRAKGDSQSSN